MRRSQVRPGKGSPERPPATVFQNHRPDKHRQAGRRPGTAIPYRYLLYRPLRRNSRQGITRTVVPKLHGTHRRGGNAAAKFLHGRGIPSGLPCKESRRLLPCPSRQVHTCAAVQKRLIWPHFCACRQTSRKTRGPCRVKNTHRGNRQSGPPLPCRTFPKRSCIPDPRPHSPRQA